MVFLIFSFTGNSDKIAVRNYIVSVYMKYYEKLPKHTHIKKKLYCRYRIILALVFLVFIIVFFVALHNQDLKPDPISEYKIRQEATQFIGKVPDELTDEDFAKITKFRLGTPEFFAGREASISRELSDLRLLEKFTNLQELCLEKINYPSTAIPKWMFVMGKFGLFDINKRFSIDLSPIEKLYSLQKLSINLTPVKDIKPLAGLTNLKILVIENTPISNLEPIKGLTRLDTLIIDNTQVSDLEPIKGLEHLRCFIADFSEISDLTPVKNLTKLQELSIRGCKNITDEQVEDLQQALPNLKISK
jgi:hypothetical protein